MAFGPGFGTVEFAATVGLPAPTFGFTDEGAEVVGLFVPEFGFVTVPGRGTLEATDVEVVGLVAAGPTFGGETATVVSVEFGLLAAVLAGVAFTVGWFVSGASGGGMGSKFGSSAILFEPLFWLFATFELPEPASMFGGDVEASPAPVPSSGVLF